MMNAKSKMLFKINKSFWQKTLSNKQTNFLIWIILLESFTRKQEYGLTILVSTDEKVNNFLKNILSQIKVSCKPTIN